MEHFFYDRKHKKNTADHLNLNRSYFSVQKERIMKRIMIFAVLAFSFTFLLSSCMVRRGVVVSSGPGGSQVRYHYWYYPSLQVYFDVERKVYYYPENGGWHQTNSLPSRYSPGSSHVTVDMDSDKPYRDFNQHKMKYPGSKGKRNDWDQQDQR